MDKRVHFHEQLRLARERNSWTQADLAEKLGVQPKTVQRWEKRGGQLPQPSQRQRICKLLEKTAEELGLVADIEVGDVPDEAEEADEGPKVPREDPGDAPDTGDFYGREEDLELLAGWIVDSRCRLVAIVGMGGMGKTTLAAHLKAEIRQEFDAIIWRSLKNAPLFQHIVRDCLQFLSDQRQLELPDNEQDQIGLLIQLLCNHRCLLVLDNFESLLQEGQRVGQYRAGYEGYGQLLQRVGEVQHQSCLLLTSREKPREVARLQGTESPVRLRQLAGVNLEEGRAIVQGKKITGTEVEWASLIARYSGNPLALKLVAQFIQEIFSGSIARFLAEDGTPIGDITEILRSQVDRLSEQEREVLTWLAIERDGAALDGIRENLVRPVAKKALFDTLDSLHRRSLIETSGPAFFTLQPVIMEYMTCELVERAVQEFGTETFDTWTNYAFCKAQVRDYVRDSQERFILGPLAQELLAAFGREGVEQRLRSMLATLRQKYLRQPGYMAGNAINLLVHLQVDLSGADFSQLMVRQASLQNVTLHGVDFTASHFMDSLFTDTFGSIFSFAFDPQGMHLVVGTTSGEIWIYNIATMQPEKIFQGHTDGVWSLAFSPDGGMLASSSDDQSVRLWDVGTGRCLHVLGEHRGRVRAVSFSPDGRLLASGSDDQTIRLWELQTPRCCQVLQGHSDRVWSVSFSPDGKLLASGGTDRTCRLWSVETGACLSILQEHTHEVRSVAFSPDGRLLASGSDDQSTKLWEVSSGACLHTLMGHTNHVWSVAFQPDGRTLVSGSEDHTIRLWDVSTGDCVSILKGHTQGVRAVAFSPDGQVFVSGGDDQALRLWEVRTRYCLQTLQGYANRVWSIDFSPDGLNLVSGSEDQGIRIWDIHTGECLKEILGERTHGVRAVAYDPTGRMVISGGEDQNVKVWDVKTGRCLKTLHGHTDWLRTVAFSPDGRIIASGSEDGTVKLWDVNTGDNLKTLYGHESWVRVVAFNIDGSMLVSGGDDKVLRLWDVETGKRVSVLSGHTERVRAAAFSPDGLTLVSGSEDYTVRLWDVETGECLRTLCGSESRVQAVAFRLGGDLLASGGDDQSISLWYKETGKLRRRWDTQAKRIRAIVFSPDGRSLASCSDDGTIKLWDVETAIWLRTLIGKRPYEGMKITGVLGLSDAKKAALEALGAIGDA